MISYSLSTPQKTLRKGFLSYLTDMSCLKIETFFKYTDSHIGLVIVNFENLVSDLLSD